MYCLIDVLLFCIIVPILYKQRLFNIFQLEKAKWIIQEPKKKVQCCCLTKHCVKMSCSTILISMLSYLLFYTIRVAFTKGPQPLVGCYSIFKHHSAKSQPPHGPALHTCNKLSSSETTKKKKKKASRTGAGQSHFTDSPRINIFIFVWLDPWSFYTVRACVWVFQSVSFINLGISMGLLLLQLSSACW